LIPKALGTNQAESVFSYLSRLATAHHVSIARLLEYLGEIAGQKRFSSIAHLSQGKLCGDSEALISALTKATGRGEVAGCTLRSLSGVLHFRRTLSHFQSPLHCPLCVEECTFPNGWNRLIWEIQCVDACVVHGVILIDSTCGRESGAWVHPQGRALLSGVCRRCGTIAFRCKDRHVCDASSAQNWIAHEIGTLVAAASSGEVFSRNVLLRTTEEVVRLSWGSLAQAERSLDLTQGCLSHVFNSSHLFEFRMFVNICAQLGVEPISMLRGNPRTGKVMPDAFVAVARTSPRRARTRAEIEVMLPEILAVSPNISFAKLISRLGVDGTRLKQRFPDIAREMRERHRYESRRRKWLRLLAIGRKFRALRAQLQAEGITFNGANIFERTGIMRRRGEPEERLFRWVQRRPWI
jgi:hypothetical protein